MSKLGSPKSIADCHHSSNGVITSLATDKTLIPLCQLWKKVRAEIGVELCNLACEQLEKRRPVTYQGLQQKESNKEDENPSEIGTLQKLTFELEWTQQWYLSVIVEHHAKPLLILLYHCPHAEPLSLEIEAWGRQPACASVLLICPNQHLLKRRRYGNVRVGEQWRIIGSLPSNPGQGA